MADDAPSTWVSATTWETPDGGPSFWPDPALATAHFWGVNKQIEYIYLSLPHSAFQINK